MLRIRLLTRATLRLAMLLACISFVQSTWAWDGVLIPTESLPGTDPLQPPNPYASQLSDGRALVIYATTDVTYGNTITVAAIYDPKSGTFGTPVPAQVPRQNGHAILLGNGKVLLVGGGD